MYLSASTTEFFKDHDRGLNVHGVMFNVVQMVGRQRDALELGCKFGVDNGVFSGKFNADRWLSGLSEFIPYRHNCLICPLPDWLEILPDGSVVGDWRKTLTRFHEYKQFARQTGLPITLVTQDGLTPDNAPWAELDAIFIGGSNYHKRGVEAERLGFAARRKGLHVHVGRVSSVWAAKRYWPWADSYDGTTYTYAPDARYEIYTPKWEEFFNSEEKMVYQYKLL